MSHFKSCTFFSLFTCARVSTACTHWAQCFKSPDVIVWFLCYRLWECYPKSYFNWTQVGSNVPCSFSWAGNCCQWFAEWVPLATYKLFYLTQVLHAIRRLLAIRPLYFSMQLLSYVLTSVQQWKWVNILEISHVSKCGLSRCCSVP
jgi:hypothetical protein